MKLEAKYRIKIINGVSQIECDLWLVDPDNVKPNIANASGCSIIPTNLLKSSVLDKLVEDCKKDALSKAFDKLKEEACQYLLTRLE